MGSGAPAYINIVSGYKPLKSLKVAISHLTIQYIITAEGT